MEVGGSNGWLHWWMLGQMISNVEKTQVSQSRLILEPEQDFIHDLHRLFVTLRERAKESCLPNNYITMFGFSSHERGPVWKGGYNLKLLQP